jgi:hypothetical protein
MCLRLYEITIIVLIEFKDQGSTAEKSSILKVNQGVCTDVLKYHPCLNFFGYFLFSRKESDKTIDTRKCIRAFIHQYTYSRNPNSYAMRDNP